MPETIGQQLKQARVARNLTIQKVTQSTRIQARFIEAMEADDFDSLPSPIQARAFLRLYAEFLDLSLNNLISHQRAEAEQKSDAFRNAIPAAGGSQAPERSTGRPNKEEPDNKSGRSQVRIFQEERKEPPTLRGSKTRRHKSNVPAEEELQETPSAPAAVPDRQVEKRGAKNQPSIPDDKDPMPPGRISSGLQSQDIFTSIGKALHERRAALSLTLEEIEEHTHVREHYLQALEKGDFSHLPSSVQTRGMLNNYAHFLDMDVDAILLRFAEGLQAQRLERQPTPIRKSQKTDVKFSNGTVPARGLRRYLSMDVIIGVGLISILLVFAIWGATRVINLRSDSTPQPTTQPISDILAVTADSGTAIPTPTSESETAVATPEVNSTAVVTVPAAGKGPVQIIVVALEQAFLRVTVDGKILFNGRVSAGNVYPFDGNSQIEVLTGNGAAISILFNQTDLGPMGGIGEVVNRIYTATAILNPTATITSTPTITPTPTTTPTPSSTPRPDSTPLAPAATQG